MPDFRALYTRHKIQKHKVWHDGRVTLNQSSGLLQLFDGDKFLDATPIQRCRPESIHHSSNNALVDTQWETEQYLILIEEEWKETDAIQPCTLPRKRTENNHNHALLHHSSVRRKKFRPPPRVVPPPIDTTTTTTTATTKQTKTLKNRKAPLQPGELQRLYYGQVPCQESASTVATTTTAPATTTTTAATTTTPSQLLNIPSKTRSEIHACLFQSAMNGFNPTDFYGEEHDDETEDSNTVQNNHPWFTSHNNNNNRTTGQGNDTHDGTTTSGTTTLSTNELLNLFQANNNATPNDFKLPSDEEETSDGEA